jgi:dienelactone hydrolase
MTFSIPALISAALVAFSTLAMAAEIPERDSRNTYTPNTDTHFSMPIYETRAAWEARKLPLREQILAAAGLLPLPPKTPLNAITFGRLEREGYTVENVYFESMPGYYLAGNLYRPRNAPGKAPGILLAHGHWTYGRLEEQPLFSGQSLGASLARQGYVAFAYDMVGYNDSVQTPHAFGGAREQLWAFGPLGLQLWNSIRALDFLLSLDTVDPAKIGMTGASGGGTQTFLLAAVDDRVRYAAPVNMVSAEMQGGDYCENAPGLRFDTFNVEIASTIAPRPMLLVSASGDWTHNVPREEFPAVQHVYSLYDYASEVTTTQIKQQHNFNKQSREAVYEFFGHHFQPAASPEAYREKEVIIDKLQDMLAFHGRALPAGAITYDQLNSAWRTMSEKQTKEMDAVALRKNLAVIMGVESPGTVLKGGDGEHIVLSRSGKGDRVPGIWIPGKGKAILIADADGAEAARSKPSLAKWVKSGRPVLLIDAFQTGSAVAARDRSHKFFLTFNRCDDANRVQDILTAAAYLRASGNEQVEIAAEGRAAIWALFAAAASPTPVTLSADTSQFQGRDEDFESQFPVPGIQRAGGVAAARRLVSAAPAGR